MGEEGGGGVVQWSDFGFFPNFAAQRSVLLVYTAAQLGDSSNRLLGHPQLLGDHGVHHNLKYVPSSGG